MSFALIAFSWPTFLAYIVPSQLCLYSMAVLVQLNGTRYYRLALLPLIAWFAWRGSLVDLSGGDPKQSQMNVMLITQMCAGFMRGIVWAIASEPFCRNSRPSTLSTALWNACDLMFNTRGIGWNWSKVTFPKPAFETDSRFVFVLWSAALLALHAFGMDTCVQIIRMLSPDTFGSVAGGSLFDNTLSPPLQLSRALFVSFLAVWIAYFAIQWSYHLLAILFTILFWQHPSQWPPLFDSPWKSTSLSELWGRRWHQMMRELLIPLGFRPVNHLFGPLAGLVGAFLVSGIFHDIELRSFGRGGNTIILVGFWVMNSVGVVLERVWKAWTGRRVGGMLGRLWTFGWLALWGVPVVNEWVKAGRFGSLSLPGDIEPFVALVKLVRS